MFKLEIKTGNAAFCDPMTGEEDNYAEAYEVARILNEVTEKIKNGQREGSCIDINGNKVGTWRF